MPSLPSCRLIQMENSRVTMDYRNWIERLWKSLDRCRLCYCSIYGHAQKFPVLGFGAKYGGVINHCFQIGSTAEEAQGIAGILQAYRSVFKSGLTMSGPTDCSEVIAMAAAQAQSKQDAMERFGQRLARHLFRIQSRWCRTFLDVEIDDNDKFVTIDVCERGRKKKEPRRTTTGVPGSTPECQSTPVTNCEVRLFPKYFHDVRQSRHQIQVNIIV